MCYTICSPNSVLLKAMTGDACSEISERLLLLTDRTKLHFAVFAAHIEGSLKGCSSGLIVQQILPQLCTPPFPLLCPISCLLHLLSHEIVLNTLKNTFCITLL